MIQDIVVKLAQAVIIASGPSHNISQEKMEIFAHSQNKIMKQNAWERLQIFNLASTSEQCYILSSFYFPKVRAVNSIL